MEWVMGQRCSQVELGKIKTCKVSFSGTCMLVPLLWREVCRQKRGISNRQGRVRPVLLLFYILEKVFISHYPSIGEVLFGCTKNTSRKRRVFNEHACRQRGWSRAVSPLILSPFLFVLATDVHTPTMHVCMHEFKKKLSPPNHGVAQRWETHILHKFTVRTRGEDTAKSREFCTHSVSVAADSIIPPSMIPCMISGRNLDLSWARLIGGLFKGNCFTGTSENTTLLRAIAKGIFVCNVLARKQSRHRRQVITLLAFPANPVISCLVLNSNLGKYFTAERSQIYLIIHAQ